MGRNGEGEESSLGTLYILANSSDGFWRIDESTYNFLKDVRFDGDPPLRDNDFITFTTYYDAEIVIRVASITHLSKLTLKSREKAYEYPELYQEELDKLDKKWKKIHPEVPE